MLLEARKENEFVFFKNSEAIEINLKTIIFIVKRPKKKDKTSISVWRGWPEVNQSRESRSVSIFVSLSFLSRRTVFK